MVEEKQGVVAQLTKGVKIAFATKKAAMAAYALFFGITAATAGFTASGMTSDQLKKQQILEQTLTELTERAEAYAKVMEELETTVVEIQTLITFLNTAHEETSTTEHVFVEHTHAEFDELNYDIQTQALLFTGHKHQYPSARTLIEFSRIDHEHPGPDVEPFIWVEHEHEVVEPVIFPQEDPEDGIRLDGEWIKL